MTTTKPIIKLLNEEQIQQIHLCALNILSETGIRVDSISVIEMLMKTGQVQVQDRIVKLSSELVEQAIHTAPSTIQVYDRNGNPAFLFGDDRLRFGVGVTALYYQDPVSDNLELFTRKHLRILTRLSSNLNNFDVVSTPGIVRDVPGPLCDMFGNLEMIANTTKPLVVLTSDDYSLEPLLKMFEGLQGDLGLNPFIIPYFNPVTPLVMNSGTLIKMEVTIERNLPFIFSSYSMAGATTPLTPTGILALLLAELLAGLTISQAMRPGTPVSLGMLPAYFDMKSMMSFYDPQSVLINLACAEIMAHYQLPHCGTSGSGMGWGMDQIAIDPYWMNTLTFALTKGGLAPFIGDSMGSKSISPCTLVNMNEVIDQARRFADGFQLDDSQIVLAEISKVGPGGSFLTSPSTLKNFRSGYYSSPIYPRWNMEKWQTEGQPDARQVLREKTQDMLNYLPAPLDYEEMVRKGEEYINSR